MHVLSYQAGVQQCGDKVRRLPRRHSQAPVRFSVRAVPHREGLAGFGTADPEPPESFPADGSTCRLGLRFLPQERRRGTIPRAFNRVLFLPRQGLPDDNRAGPHRRRVLYLVRAVPRFRHLVQRSF